MTGIKEIRTKIKSIQGTKKITRAMEMVAASKMRRAQERMKNAYPYSEKVKNIAANLSQANTEYKSIYMIERQPKTVGFILVTTDKGLCGGLNTNILRKLLNAIENLHAQKIKCIYTAVGVKGLHFLNRINAQVISQVIQLGDTPHLEKMIGAISVQLHAYENREIDAIYVVYTKFINTMQQIPIMLKLLPLSKDYLFQTNSASETNSENYSWDYIYEPDSKLIIDELLKRYIEGLIYQAVLESIASEQSARMVAMKAASDNAQNAIDELKLIYNKTRQFSITKELSEIVSSVELT